MIADLWQDLRFSVRTLKTKPGFTLAAVIVLALGIGANTAIFSVIMAVLARPLPFGEPETLVYLWNTNPAVGARQDYFRDDDILAFRAEERPGFGSSWRAVLSLRDSRHMVLTPYTNADREDVEQIVLLARQFMTVV